MEKYDKKTLRIIDRTVAKGKRAADRYFRRLKRLKRRSALKNKR